jgi:hypothetical protein
MSIKNKNTRMTRVVHCKKEHYDVYIGRGPNSKWGNPFTHIDDRKTAARFIVESREKAIAAYREWILNGDGKHLLNDLHELEGKTLGCWCCQTPSYYVKGMKMVCHGEVLMEIIETNNQIKNMTPEEAKTELIKVLEGQIMDLVIMSKIELGDDVIAEIKRLKQIIDEKI